MTNEQETACPECVRAKRPPAAWRHTGESCGHVECPNRRPVTAAPPGPRGYGPPSDEPPLTWRVFPE